MLVTPLSTVIVGKTLFITNAIYEVFSLEDTGVYIKGSNEYLHYFSQNPDDPDYYLNYFKEV